MVWRKERIGIQESAGCAWSMNTFPIIENPNVLHSYASGKIQEKRRLCVLRKQECRSPGGRRSRVSKAEVVVVEINTGTIGDSERSRTERHIFLWRNFAFILGTYDCSSTCKYTNLIVPVLIVVICSEDVVQVQRIKLVLQLKVLADHWADVRNTAEVL